MSMSMEETLKTSIFQSLTTFSRPRVCEGSASRLDSRTKFYPKHFITARLNALVLTLRRLVVYIYRHFIAWTPVIRLRFVHMSIS